MSKVRDKYIAKVESNTKRNKKKSCKPTDNYGDRYVTGYEKQRTQGKGDRNRDISGWYSDEVSQRLNIIFNRRQKAYSENTSATPLPEYE